MSEELPKSEIRNPTSFLLRGPFFGETLDVAPFVIAVAGAGADFLNAVPAGTIGDCSLKYSGKTKSKSGPNTVLAFVACISCEPNAKSNAIYFEINAILSGVHVSGATPKILYSTG